jgi:hypothetical protein
MSQSFQNVNGKIRFPDEKLVPDNIEIKLFTAEEWEDHLVLSKSEFDEDGNEVQLPIGNYSRVK